MPFKIFKILKKVQNNAKIVAWPDDPPITILSGGSSLPTTIEQVGKYEVITFKLSWIFKIGELKVKHMLCNGFRSNIDLCNSSSIRKFYTSVSYWTWTKCGCLVTDQLMIEISCPSVLLRVCIGLGGAEYRRTNLAILHIQELIWKGWSK